jgi:hypothetical protein
MGDGAVKRGVVLPARPQQPVVDHRHASFFLSILFFLAKATGQKNGLATVLGEACGVDDTDRRAGLGACLLELPCLYQEPAGWHIQ